MGLGFVPGCPSDAVTRGRWRVRMHTTEPSSDSGPMSVTRGRLLLSQTWRQMWRWKERRVPVDFSSVFAAELELLARRRHALGLDDAPLRSSSRSPSTERGLTGLSLSGGGIRSATFCLGVLQALGAERLRKFDYLSTVSGGGFIGATLTSAGGFEERGDQPGEAEAEFPFSKPRAKDSAVVRHLRNNSSYLNPGRLFDSARLPAIAFRGALLNLLVVLPWLFLAVALTRLFYSVVYNLDVFQYVEEIPLVLVIPFVLLLIVYPLIPHWQRRGWCTKERYERLFAGSLIFALLGVLMRFGIMNLIWAIEHHDEARAALWTVGRAWLIAAGALLALYGGLGVWNARLAKIVRGLVLCVLGASVPLALAGVYVYLCITTIPTPVVKVADHEKTLGLLANEDRTKTFAQSEKQATAPKVASDEAAAKGDPSSTEASGETTVSSHENAGSGESSEGSKGEKGGSNEKLAGDGSSSPSVGSGWEKGGSSEKPASDGRCSIVRIDREAKPHSEQSKSGVNLSSTGSSNEAEGEADEKLASGDGSSSSEVSEKECSVVDGKMLRWLSRHGLYFSEATLRKCRGDDERNQTQWGILEGSCMVIEGGGKNGKEMREILVKWKDPSVRRAPEYLALDRIPSFSLLAFSARKRAPYSSALAVVSLIVLAMYIWGLDANELSLHGFYRDCLARVFVTRVKGPKKDMVESMPNLLLSELDPSKSGAPYHLINATLNLRGATEVTLRDRKGAAFLFSPLFVGSEPTQYASTKDMEAAAPGFSLASAVAVSAAAAGPNMGSFTSGWIAPLLTLLNLRLGYWLPHPKAVVRESGFRHTAGLKQMLQEALGQVNERGLFVNVSDGGHFENSGAYELIRRRCRLIVMVDGEQDPRGQLGCLTTLMRLARIDFGTTITADVASFRAQLARGELRRPWLWAQVHYGQSEGREEVGHLLYIKAAMTGGEPEYVQTYREQRPEFPHESTANQFFNEVQFESYRALGEHIGASIGEEGTLDARMSEVLVASPPSAAAFEMARA